MANNYRNMHQAGCGDEGDLGTLDSFKMFQYQSGKKKEKQILTTDVHGRENYTNAKLIVALVGLLICMVLLLIIIIIAAFTSFSREAEAAGKESVVLMEELKKLNSTFGTQIIEKFAKEKPISMDQTESDNKSPDKYFKKQPGMTGLQFIEDGDRVVLMDVIGFINITLESQFSEIAGRGQFIMDQIKDIKTTLSSILYRCRYTRSK